MKENKTCSFNLSFGAVEYLNQNGVTLYDGNIGKLVRMSYGMYNSSLRCLTQADLPKNLHEYSKIIIDLTHEIKIDYESKDHIRKENKSNNDTYLTCYKPQNIFDPRALVLKHLQSELVKNLEQGLLLIVFCSQEESIEYHYSGNGRDSRETANIYSFLPNIPERNNKHGEIVKVPSGKNEIYNFLRKYSDNARYHVTFYTPTIYQEGKWVKDPSFHPLMHSHSDEIVSFYNITGDSGIFFFPDIEDKAIFLKEFLTEIAPTFLPKLFPEQVKNNWLEESRYSLPNHDRLLSEKIKVEKEYENLINLKNEEIANNKLKYSFLTDMLIHTDDVLVATVIKFLEWLGFENVKDADTINTGKIREEDIQINTEKGLIIIEVKGLGGTSKDSDCNQIGKVKYRRAKERGKFDVYAHYIVNHQRHLPAANRVNPPFTSEQITDAENDERGLFTTWQLFNLYSAIENGILTKVDARESFYGYGYIDFIPKNKIKLGTPKELLKNNTIVILDVKSEPKVKINDKILFVYRDHFQLETILSIQANDKNLSESIMGEIGIKLTNPIKKGAVLYV